jgi:hypothetical protein
MTKAIRIQVVSLTALALLLATASGSFADPTKCKQGIAKASAKYVQGRSKALQKCEDSKTKGKLPAGQVCTTETKTQMSLSKLDTKLHSDVAKVCGGTDKICGTPDGDDSMASIGWPAACPDFESSSCNNLISNCNDVSDCLECINDVAVDQAIALYYASLQQGQFGTNSVTNKCQQAIGKATAKFLQAKSKALQKCWDARLKGLHNNACPVPGDGKAAATILNAETKKVQAICKACGGPDKLCDNNADLSPNPDIGFVTTCPSVCNAVTTPAACATTCGAPIVVLSDLVTCVDCMTEFKVDCMDALAVPEFVSPLPAECNPNSTTTTTTTTTTNTLATTTTTTSTTLATTTTTTTTTTLGTTSTTTTTTLATTTTTTTTTTLATTTTTTTTTTLATTTTTTHTTTTSTTTTVTTTSTTTTTAGGPSFADFTTSVGSGNCGQTFRNTNGTGNILKNLGCGGLDIGGGSSTVAEGPTPDGSTNRMTTSCVGSNCTLGPVAADGATFKCTNTGCVFGTPLPIVNGTLSTCVQNTFASPLSGTLDTSNGNASININLSSASIVTGNATQPCPICRVGSISGAPCVGSPGSPCTGVCEGSPNQGSACVSTNSQGLTNDCPNVGSSGAGNKCYKGTNNNGACTSNAACTGGGVCAVFVGNIPVNLSPATTGLAQMADSGGIFCPTKHCQSGTSYGAVCTVDTDCPGSTQTGRCIGQGAGQVGAFVTDVCLAGANSGLPCKVATQATDCPGSTCKVGSGNNMCNGGANDGKGCTTSTDCGGSPCVRAGTLARLIKEQGAAPGVSLLPVNTSHAARLASVFCIPDADSSPNGGGQGFLISAAANLPGPGATTLPGTIVLRP